MVIIQLFSTKHHLIEKKAGYVIKGFQIFFLNPTGLIRALGTGSIYTSKTNYTVNKQHKEFKRQQNLSLHLSSVDTRLVSCHIPCMMSYHLHKMEYQRCFLFLSCLEQPFPTSICCCTKHNKREVINHKITREFMSSVLFAGVPVEDQSLLISAWQTLEHVERCRTAQVKGHSVTYDTIR